ncbi:MAG TPA: Gfo/Idh/MocA family oxidoreductase [Flavitalea sp.]|nr:Gfo/Idh/MocA family oxidoreductase [Flavitalea sp.]
MRKLKTGIVGYGKSAKVFHIPFLSTMDQFSITSVLERHGAESKKQLPDIRVARSIEELINKDDTELIVITTPNDTHFDYAAKAMKAGKHVVLEKPFTNTSWEAEKLISISRDTGKVLSVYQNRRYVSDFLTIRDILDKNLLGRVHEFNATYDRFRPAAIPGAWRESDMPGSGILYDLGPHLIDQALILFGNPEAITADIRKQRSDVHADDYFNLWLHYGFLKVILHSGMLVREQGPRYMIHGTSGSFIKYGEDPQEEKLRAGSLPVGDDWGQEPDEHYGILHTEINGNVFRQTVPSRKGDYGQYYKNVYETIVNNAPLLEKPEHGYNTIKIVELALESSKLKKTLTCHGLKQPA